MLRRLYFLLPFKAWKLENSLSLSSSLLNSKRTRRVLFSSSDPILVEIFQKIIGQPCQIFFSFAYTWSCLLSFSSAKSFACLMTFLSHSGVWETTGTDVVFLLVELAYDLAIGIAFYLVTEWFKYFSRTCPRHIPECGNRDCSSTFSWFQQELNFYSCDEFL